mmetsp:Transcript_11158/g.35207  ORF Transcript_11158/g.35207 Transcript_11158/m.35207 type:complete len:207 (-) Transcript_11158:580-1200(-)
MRAPQMNPSAGAAATRRALPGCLSFASRSAAPRAHSAQAPARVRRARPAGPPPICSSSSRARTPCPSTFTTSTWCTTRATTRVRAWTRCAASAGSSSGVSADRPSASSTRCATRRSRTRCRRATRARGPGARAFKSSQHGGRAARPLRPWTARASRVRGVLRVLALPMALLQARTPTRSTRRISARSAARTSRRLSAGQATWPAAG